MEMNPILFIFLLIITAFVISIVSVNFKKTISRSENDISDENYIPDDTVDSQPRKKASNNNKNNADLTEELYNNWISGIQDGIRQQHFFWFSGKKILFLFSNLDNKMKLEMVSNLFAFHNQKQLIEINTFQHQNINIEACDQTQAYAILTSNILKLTDSFGSKLKMEIKANLLVFQCQENNIFNEKNFYHLIRFLFERFQSYGNSANNLLINNILNDPSPELKVKNLQLFLADKKIREEISQFKWLQEQFPELLFIIEEYFSNNDLNFFFNLLLENHSSDFSLSDNESLLNHYKNLLQSLLNNIVDFDAISLVNQFIIAECESKNESYSDLFLQLINKTFPFDENVRKPLIHYFLDLNINESSDCLISLINFGDIHSLSLIVETIINKGDHHSILKLKQSIVEYKQMKSILNFNNQVLAILNDAIKKLQDKVPQETYGGLSMVDNKPGSLSINQNHEQGSLSINQNHEQGSLSISQDQNQGALSLIKDDEQGALSITSDESNQQQ